MHILGAIAEFERERIRERVMAGLALARRILEAQQGRIWVQSEPGQGTTFTIHLPMIQNRAQDK
jgi:signal transduction histidine kinase